MRQIAILYGGYSNEREVSIKSGIECYNALKKQGEKTHLIDVQDDNSIFLTLKKIKPDIALNCLHGGIGENGTIQGLLEIMHIPYTHSGVHASAISMSKSTTLNVLNKIVPSAPSILITFKKLKKMNFPGKHCIVKPDDGGSTLNLHVAKNENTWKQIIKQLILSDSPPSDSQLFLVEDYIVGKELTVTILGGKALDIIEVSTDKSIYDFESKYENSSTKLIIPAKIPPNVYQNIQVLSEAVYKRIRCKGLARVDWLLSNDGPIFLEINTVPGLTKRSMAPIAAAYYGLSFVELIKWMILDASTKR